MRMAMILTGLVLPLAVQAAGDPKLGKALHEKQCVECHVRLAGGDGSGIYTRKSRLIKNATALSQRVATCSTQIGAGWFPDEEAHVAAWLNQTYYKFK